MLRYLQELEKYIPSLPLDGDLGEKLTDAVRGCIADDRLCETVKKYYTEFFETEKHQTRDIELLSDSYADRKLGDCMIFTVVFLVRAYILVSEKIYVYNGEPINFFAPLLRQLGVNISRNSSVGFKKAQRFWAYSYLRPISFELGRLAFEILTYNYGYEIYINPETKESVPVALPGLKFNKDGLPDSEGCFETTFSSEGDIISGYTYTEDGLLDFEKKTLTGFVKAVGHGDSVIAIHMPGNAKLSDEAVSSSLDGARNFFEKYFPDLNYKAFVSSSWLLDTGLRKILKEDSNIVKLQKRFKIALAFENDFSLFDNIFDVPKCPIEELVPQNRFQEEVLNMIKGGRPLYSGRGYILK